MGGGTIYRLINHRFSFLASQSERLINGQTVPSIPTADLPVDGNYYYIHDRDSNRWYEYGLPIEIATSCTSCDLENMWQAFVNESLVIAGRYFLPVEDVIILITGEDFDGIKSSRAIAGGFVLAEIIPGSGLVKAIKLVKYGDEAIQLVSAGVKYVDNIYKQQKFIIDKVLEGDYQYDLDLFSNTNRKGNFGEMVTDTDLFENGYDVLHNRINNLDEGTVQGIDGIFKNPTTGEYIIVESKYGTSQLSTLADGTMQMSQEWIEGGDRLLNAVGQEIAEDIIDTGYTRVLSQISSNGSIIYNELDTAGQVIGTWVP